MRERVRCGSQDRGKEEGGGLAAWVGRGRSKSLLRRLRRWHDDDRTISGEQRVGNPPAYRKQGGGGGATEDAL